MATLQTAAAPSRPFPELRRQSFVTIPSYQVQSERPRQNFLWLEPGKTIERTLAGGETHSYSVALKAGEYLKIAVDQRGIDVLLRILSPDNILLVETDSLNTTQGLEAASTIAGQPGAFRVEVVSTTKGVMAGRYRIRIDAVRPPIEQDRKWIEAQTAMTDGLRLWKSDEQGRRSAIASFEKAALYWEEAGDKIKQAHALTYIGQGYDHLGQHQKSLDYRIRALRVIQSAGDPYEEAHIKYGLGLAYTNTGEPRKALEYGQSALAFWQSIKDPANEGLALNLIGLSYRMLAQPRKALEYLNQGLSIFERVNDPQHRANILDSMANAYGSIDETQRAMECDVQALAIYQSIGDRYMQANTLRNIGRIYFYMGDSLKALAYYNQSLSFWQAIGDLRHWALTLGFIGDVHAQLGDYQTALEDYRKALTQIAGTGDRRSEAEILRMAGDAYAAMNDPRQALRNYERALAAFRAMEYRLGEASVTSRIGVAYNALGEAVKAIGYFKNALDMLQIIEDHQGRAFALLGIARAERKLGNLDQSRAQLEAALTEIEIIRAHNKDQQQLTFYLTSTQTYYDEYISLLMQLHKSNSSAGYDGLALEACERARARGLLEMLAEARVDFRQGVDATLIDRERNLSEQLKEKADQRFALFSQTGSREQLAALNGEISELEDRLQQVKASIRARSPRYAELTQPRPLTLREIQQQVLDKESLLLEYSLGADRSFLWVVSDAKVSAYELPGRDVIESAARRVRSFLIAPGASVSRETPLQRRRRLARSDARLAEASATLSRMVLGPAASDLGNKRLIVVADAGMHYIPFAMLPAPELGISRDNSAGSNRLLRSRYEPLILRHEIINLPSASALAVLRKTTADRKPAPKGVAVIADPVFARSDPRVRARFDETARHEGPAEPISQTRILEHIGEVPSFPAGRQVIPRLPFTRREGEQILGLASGMTNVKALDFKANRAFAIGEELSQYRYLHFATHGYLDSERPGLSALVLSLVDEQGKPQNGLLSANEIYNLNLPAELVVLSACQTGLGKQMRGEGVLGLTRGFMYAGASRVVVSLWNVSDRATAELMQRFYRGIFKEGQRPAAALRTAQLEMFNRKVRRSPYYWAAFTLQGEWQ